MFWLIAVSIAAHSDAQPISRAPATPAAQAIASVRILRAARVDFRSGVTGEVPAKIRPRLRIGEATYPARIIEFE
jgi:hypothetical protein